MMVVTRKSSLHATFSGWNPTDVNFKMTTKLRTRKKRCRPVSRRRSRPPQTPLLKWKMEEIENGGVVDEELEDEMIGDGIQRMKGASTVSARKLAAGLWRLQLPETVAAGGGERIRDHLGIKADDDFMGVSLLYHHKDKIHGSVSVTKDPLPSSTSFSCTKNGPLYKIEPPIQYSNYAMEGVTRWDPVCLKSTDEVRRIHNHMKNIDRQVNEVSIVSTLEAEIEQARTRIEELETECRSSNKKLEHFSRKVNEERAEWRSREHEKVRVIVGDIKADLNREKKNCQRLGVANSKLVNELAAAKLSAKQYMQRYEKERKARKLIEKVCDELANEIGEDKAEAEALRSDTMKFREEVDEERRKLQMVEVWREEHVQMKLIDAKIALENRYSHMNKLIADMETFLRSRTGTLDMEDLREAESLRQAALKVNVQVIKEFTYEPPNPDDISAVFEGVALASETEIEPSVAYSPATTSYASKVHTASPEMSMIRKGSILRHSIANFEMEEDAGMWETVSHLEDQGSSYSPEGSASYVNKNHRHSYFSGSGTEWEDTPTTEFSEVCSLPSRQVKKVSSMERLWRSCQNKGEKYKIISVEGTNHRLSYGRKSNGSIMSPDQWSDKGGFSPSEMMGRRSSPDSGSAHPRITERCTEWSRGPQTKSLKAELLEARMETQKVQLRHVLKQKI